MSKLNHLVVVLITVIFPFVIFSQVITTAVPFLSISPNTEANGMGEASVAYSTDAPLSVVSNPAHLGLQSLGSYLLSGYSYANWLPGLGISDLKIHSFSINSGVNLKKTFGTVAEIGLGIAYSRLYLDYGEFHITEPVLLHTFCSHEHYEKFDQFSLGVGLNYGIILSIGMSYKHAVSNFAVEKGKAGLFDYGFLVDVPVKQLISTTIDNFQNVPLYFDLRMGLSRNNLGQKEVFYKPLPRTAHAGIGLDIGYMYNKNDINWKLISFKWTVEAEDLLVRGDSSGGWEYQSGFGDICLFDEIILGKTNAKTVKKKGYEINFYELFYIRGGRFEEDITEGNRHFSTRGLSLRLTGLSKFMLLVFPSLGRNEILGFVLEHIDFRYDFSKWDTDKPGHPLSNTKWYSYNLFIRN